MAVTVNVSIFLYWMLYFQEQIIAWPLPLRVQLGLVVTTNTYYVPYFLNSYLCEIVLSFVLLQVVASPASTLTSRFCNHSFILSIWNFTSWKYCDRTHFPLQGRICYCKWWNKLFFYPHIEFDISCLYGNLYIHRAKKNKKLIWCQSCQLEAKYDIPFTNHKAFGTAAQGCWIWHPNFTSLLMPPHFCSKMFFLFE